MADMTCQEAAEKLFAQIDRTPYEGEAGIYQGAAEVLSAFGDTPVPEGVLRRFSTVLKSDRE